MISHDYKYRIFLPSVSASLKSSSSSSSSWFWQDWHVHKSLHLSPPRWHLQLPLVQPDFLQAQESIMAFRWGDSLHSTGERLSSQPPPTAEGMTMTVCKASFHAWIWYAAHFKTLTLGGSCESLSMHLVASSLYLASVTSVKLPYMLAMNFSH